MAAARDVRPVYYERYMIDYNNKAPDVQQAARDRIHWFFSMDYAGRRQYSENIATDIYYEQMAFRWPNWAKLFFNNKGVAARTTDVRNQYPADDPGVWQQNPASRHAHHGWPPAAPVSATVGSGRFGPLCGDPEEYAEHLALERGRSEHTAGPI